MNGTPILRQLVHRLMTHQLGARRDPDELASAAVTLLERLLISLSSLLGKTGSLALFRRSLRLTEATFPSYAEVRGADQNGLLKALEACLRKQAPDVAWDAAVTLLTAHVELLATFISVRLTRQLLQETWPDVLTVQEEERVQ